jgi:DNA gyrase/topoisomerase IV subunit A
MIKTMPTKPKTEQINKKISTIVDKKLTSLDKTHYKRWLKVAELSIQLSDWLQALNTRLNTYLPHQEILDRKIENDLNKIKGEIHTLQNLSEVLKNICSTTVNRITIPPPPPPPPKKIIKTTSPTKSSSTIKNTSSTASQFMHNPLEIKKLANTMNKSRREKIHDIETLAKDLKKIINK